MDASASYPRTLLIHHHAVTWQSDGALYAPSFIGAWVEAIAPFYDRIGLLLHETTTHTARQDFAIRAPNVVLHSLGAPTTHSKSRNETIKDICREVSSQYDCLVVRGVTPRQNLVFQVARTPVKAFLLVGSIMDSAPAFGFSRMELLLWGLHKLRAWQLRRIARASDVMMANSPRIVGEVREQFGVEAAFVPTNSIRADHFVFPRFRGFRPRPELLYCGRVVRDKGAEEMVEALGFLRSQGSKCLLRFVGNVTDLYRSELQELADSCGVGDQLRFEGFVVFGELLLSFYREADLFVLPSWHEGFPHSVWEAAASMTPIVVTPVGGVPGIVSGREVTFTPPMRADELAATIAKVLSEPVEAEKKAQAAYRLAQGFTVEQCARQIACTLSRYPVRTTDG